MYFLIMFYFDTQIMWLVDIFRGKIVDISDHFLTIEVTSIFFPSFYMSFELFRVLPWGLMHGSTWSLIVLAT